MNSAKSFTSVPIVDVRGPGIDPRFEAKMRSYVGLSRDGRTRPALRAGEHLFVQALQGAG